MTKKTKAKAATLIFLLVVSALLIFLNSFGRLKQPKDFVIYIINPVQKTFQTLSSRINYFSHTLTEIGDLKKEKVELKKENLKLVYEISQLREIKRENSILRQQLNFSDNICQSGTCLDWIMAKVIGRNPDSYNKYIVIDVGENDGVEENQAVVISNGIMIGKIAELFDNFSKVILITDSESSVNSITQTTRANGIVKGKYSTGAKLEMINQSEQLIDGDLIITSGLEKKIPKGLMIGKISAVEESANQVFKQANINLLADFNHLEEVFIAKKKNGQ
jgi:rod shape-determining protein MreC